MWSVQRVMNKYDPLSIYLNHLTETYIELSFEQIESILKTNLPVSARTIRQWWSNDQTSHVQSRDGWLCVGWRIVHVDLHREIVVFAHE